nr:MAG TPA: hypothetical protein [Caudoviricetes sp.]
MRRLLKRKARITSALIQSQHNMQEKQTTGSGR